MKTFGRTLLLAALGLWSCSSLNLQAQALPFNFQLNMQQQDTSTLNNGTYNDKVKTTKLTTTSVLNLLAVAYSTNFPTGFPAGAKLVLVNYGFFQVQAADGSVLIDDVSAYLTYSDSYSADDFLFQGKDNTNNGVQSYTYFYTFFIQFNDQTANGTTFTFSGNAQEKFSRSAADSFGFRVFQDSLTLNGYGEGRTAGKFFLLSGRTTTPTVKWQDQD